VLIAHICLLSRKRFIMQSAIPFTNTLKDTELVYYPIETYPTGASVELNSGVVGIVISQNPEMRLKPNVVLLLEANKQEYPRYLVLPLGSPDSGNKPNNLAMTNTLENGTFGINVEELNLD